jgi:hypothetical protein
MEHFEVLKTVSLHQQAIQAIAVVLPFRTKFGRERLERPHFITSQSQALLQRLERPHFITSQSQALLRN